MTFRKPELIPLIFIICATVMLGGLGAWQVQRLMWKNNLIADIEKAQSQPALQSLTLEPYRRVELNGEFIGHSTIRIVGRPQWEQGSGYFMLYPFKLHDGKIVLVNVGWAPSGWKGDMSHQHHVTGILRTAREKRLFSPDNHPEKNIWFYEDTTAMGSALGLTLQDMVVEATGERKTGVYPAPSDGKISLRNDHLGYAITWFSLAAIGIIMFGVYHRVPEQHA